MTVNSTFTPPQTWQKYNDPKNWTPAEVPNNSPERFYNVAVPAGKYLSVDLDATINNLALDRSLLAVEGHSLIVQGQTTISGPLPTEDQFVTGPNTQVQISTGKLDAGALSSFRDGVLTGAWDVRRGASALTPSTLQFDGANVVTLRKAHLALVGPLSRVIDENGNDGLRNLAHIESTASLIMSRDFATVGAFTNDGQLRIGGAFHIQGPLTNFDAATRTLASGRYWVSQSYDPQNTAATPGILRFAGADIVTNAAELELIGALSTITDLNGANALRNFTRNAESGVFRLSGRNFSTSGDFTNDGLLDGTGTFAVTGALTNYDPATRRLAGGKYHLELRFKGADIVRNAASIRAGSIRDENGQDALRNFATNEEAGTFSVSGMQFVPAGEFTNAGTVFIGGNLSRSGIGMPEGVPYVQVSGETYLFRSAEFYGRMEIRGGSLHGEHSVHGETPRIRGDLLIADGGSLVLGYLPVEGKVEFTTLAAFRIQVSDSTRGLQVNGNVHLAGTLEIEFGDVMPPDSNSALQVVQATALTGTFGNAPHGTRVTTKDGRSSFVVLYQNNAVYLTGYERIPPAAQLLNISSRAHVGTGAEVPIAGFIVTTNNKKVVARAIGPSLQQRGVSGALQDPTLTLYDSAGTALATNDDWSTSQADEIAAIGLAPEDPREAAIVTTLGRGLYTAIMRGKNDTTGVGLVEIYDAGQQSGGRIANLSTRAFVDPENPLIGGFISGGGEGPAEVFVRAVGPSLKFRSVENPLPDPTLEVRGENGDLLAYNDDHETLVEGAEPSPFYFGAGDAKDALIFARLAAGNYTAVVRGKNADTGIALVEFYDINR